MLSEEQTRLVRMQRARGLATDTNPIDPIDVSRDNLNHNQRDDIVQAAKRTKSTSNPENAPSLSSVILSAFGSTFSTSLKAKPTKARRMYANTSTFSTASSSDSMLNNPVYANYFEAHKTPSFRMETMQDRLALLLSQALMPRNPVVWRDTENTEKETELHTHTSKLLGQDTHQSCRFGPQQLQVMFVLLCEVVQKLSTVVYFQADEMATTILMAKRLCQIGCPIPLESIRIVACTCALVASKHCNDNHYNLDAFASKLHLNSKTLKKFERMLLQVLLRYDKFVVNTKMVEEAILNVERANLDYSDVMAPYETTPIWSVERIRAFTKQRRSTTSTASSANPSSCSQRQSATDEAASDLSDDPIQTSPQTAPTTPVRRTPDDLTLPTAIEPKTDYKFSGGRLILHHKPIHTLPRVQSLIFGNVQTIAPTNTTEVHDDVIVLH